MCGYRAPPGAISKFPQLLTLFWMAVCTLSMLLSLVRLMCNISVSLTYRIADRCCCRFVIRQRDFAPCPFFLCAQRMHMLMTAHPAGAALLPWHNPCVLMLIPPPANAVESPNPICRKNFMFSITPSMVSISIVGTPKAWNTNDAIVCAILP